MAIVVLALSLLPTLLVAQNRDDHGERDHAEKRCREATEVLGKHHIEQGDKWAFAVVMRCPDAGRAFAAAWGHLPTNPAVFQELINRSGEVSDRRILNAAMGTLQSATVETQRRGALDAVLKQFHPSLVLGRAWNNPENTTLGSLSDYYQRPGEQPITPADRQRVVDLFRQMSTRDANAQWRRVATRLATDLPAIRQ
jgi:hypothetical protein